MAKRNTEQEKVIKATEFINSISLLCKKLIYEVPGAIDFLEMSSENNPSDFGEAVVRLLKAAKEMQNQ